MEDEFPNVDEGLLLLDEIDLERVGTQIDTSDTLNAAHALTFDDTLVTANAELDRVPG